MIGAADVDVVGERERRDALLVAPLDERPVALHLGPLPRHLHGCVAAVDRQMVRFHPRAVQPAGASRVVAGAVKQIPEEHRSRTRRHVGDRLVVDDIPRRRHAVEAIGADPRRATVERVQVIDIGAGEIIVQPPAVDQLRDVVRRVHPVGEVGVLPGGCRIDDRRPYLRQRGGLRCDVLEIVGVVLPAIAAQFRPQHHRIGLVPLADRDLIAAHVQRREGFRVHLRDRLDRQRAQDDRGRRGGGRRHLDANQHLVRPVDLIA